MSKAILAIAMVLVAGSVSAAKSSVSLVMRLEKLTMVKMSEKNGDELFLDCLKTSNQNSKPIHFQVPEKPHYWPAKIVGQIAKVPLWQGAVAMGETVQFRCSLVEQDAPPWNRNDTIDSYALSVSNQQGQLHYQLEQGGVKQAGLVGKNALQPLDLKGGGGEYILLLKLL